MKIPDQNTTIWGKYTKERYIDPKSLPAKHKWRYSNSAGISIAVVGMVMALFLWIIIDAGSDITSLNNWINFYKILALFCIIFALYGLMSVFIRHELEITENKVRYTVKTLTKSKVVEEPLNKFSGIIIRESQRWRRSFWDKYFSSETIFTVLLDHPEILDTRFPLYESSTKEVASIKAKRYSELLKIPVIDN